MRFLSGFSGIEAASVAWAPLGWESAGFMEVDPFACAVLSHRYPHVPNMGSVAGVDEAAIRRLGPVDLFAFGWPCQDLSVAGKRAGLGGARSGLFYEATRILRLVERHAGCRWFVAENVPGLLSSGHGRDFAEVLREITGCTFPVPRDGWPNSGVVARNGGGWSVAWRVLDAQYVRVGGFGRAVPQRRRRVFVVGHLGDWRRAAAVLFDRESLSGNPPPGREAGEVVTQALTGGASSSSAGNPDDNRAQGNFLIPVGHDPSGSVARTLTGHPGGFRLDLDTENFVAHSLRADGFDASEDGTGRGTPIVPVAVMPIQNATRGKDQNGLGIGEPGAPMYTLDNASQHAIAFQERGRDGGRTLEWQEDVSYALRALDGGGCGDWFRVAYGWAVRRLTPRECERLQGFPDDWTLVPYRGKPATDGNRYKAVGNSFAVNVVRWIGQGINEVETIGV